MDLANRHISVDWGMSNFRATIVDSNSLALIETFVSDQGVKKTFDTFENQTELDKEDFFIKVLLDELSNLDTNTDHLPIVTSGMASSSLGIRELPYADFPLVADGKTLHCETIQLPGRDLLIISGAKDDVGFMRGEEVQAIGLSEHLDQSSPCTLILPGTHSKHLLYDQGKFHSMKNFMTGELFQILSEHSILSHSVKQSSLNDATKEAFIQGLDIGSSETLTSSLLNIRYQDLINKAPSEHNYFLLSGMLIGNELNYLKEVSNKLFLAATGELHQLYSIALHHMCNQENVVCLDQKLYEAASIRGQRKVLELLIF